MTNKTGLWDEVANKIERGYSPEAARSAIRGKYERMADRAEAKGLLREAADAHDKLSVLTTGKASEAHARWARELRSRTR